MTKRDINQQVKLIDKLTNKALRQIKNQERIGTLIIFLNGLVT